MTLKIGALTKLGLFFPVVCFIHMFDQTLAEQLYRDNGSTRRPSSKNPAKMLSYEGRRGLRVQKCRSIFSMLVIRKSNLWLLKEFWRVNIRAPCHEFSGRRDKIRIVLQA